MVEKSGFDLVSDIVTAEMFYKPINQTIYAAMCRLVNKFVTPDLLTVVTELKSKNELDECGGVSHISGLTNRASGMNLATHAKVIVQKFMQREMIRTCAETLSAAYDDATDAFELLDATENKIFQISNIHNGKDYQSTESLVPETLARAEYLMNHSSELTGIPTGFSNIDKLTCGWQNTDLIILAARPSMGKSAFALNLARNAAINHIKPTPVAFFSLEMSNGQLMDRLISSESGVALEKIKTGKLEDYDLNELAAAGERLSRARIFIDDKAALSIFEFRAKARRLVSKHKVGLIIIDYLQLMTTDGQVRGNREQEISHISRSIKALAKELNVPIIALSQLSRDVEKRGSMEPMLSDLRESGAIEQDADVVAFLYRNDYGKMKDEVDPATDGKTIVKFAKHRNGPLEKLSFDANLSIQKFSVSTLPQFTVVTKPSTNGNWKPVESWSSSNDE